MSLADDFGESFFSRKKSDFDDDGDEKRNDHEDPDYEDEEDGGEEGEEELDDEEEGEEEEDDKLDSFDDSYADSTIDSSSSATEQTLPRINPTGPVRTGKPLAANGLGAGKLKHEAGDYANGAVTPKNVAGSGVNGGGNEIDLEELPLTTDAERLAYIEIYFEQNAPKERHFKCKLCFDKAFLNCYKVSLVTFLYFSVSYMNEDSFSSSSQ